MRKAKTKSEPVEVEEKTEKPRKKRASRFAHDAETLAKIYDNNREAVMRRHRETRRAGMEIGPLPEVADPARRNACKLSLELFLTTYFPNVFTLLPFSPAHIRCIAKLEKSITDGGQFALALPRGHGKTSICVRAGLWALLYGYKKFVLMIGANEDAANELLDALETELEFNELLIQDFPEVCIPYKRLEGQNKRAVGQTVDGQKTRMDISSGQFVFPTIKDSPSSGACVRAAGILARLRGMSHIGPDGIPHRPDLVICDDPQTDESAASPEGNLKRLRLLNGPILGLGGPGVKVSCVMPCTVIRNGDMADAILDPEKSPAWHGERHKLMPSMPNEKAMALWLGEYKNLWAHSLRTKGTIEEATEFYRLHREEMDSGAVEGWPQRYNPDEISATQNALNLLLRDEESFFSEYQNEPKKEDAGERGNLAPEHIEAKINGKKRGEIPIDADKLILAIDVQMSFLPWVLVSFSDDYTCHVVDYGAWPEQQATYYTVESANPTLEVVYPGRALESRTYAALSDLTKFIVEQNHVREDGTPIAVDGIIIDSGWGRSTDVVLQFCRETPYKNMTYAYKGLGVGPNNKSLSEYRKEPGLKIGLNWQLKPMAKHSRQKLLLSDSYFWKSFLRDRILTPIGDRGCLTICGNPQTSQLITDACTSEYSRVVVGHRRIDEWKTRPGRTNNHLWDCLDMALVCASVLGCQIMATTQPPAPIPQPQPAPTPQPEIISTVREKRDGKANYPIPSAPKPTRQRRPALSGTISVKR